MSSVASNKFIKSPTSIGVGINPMYPLIKDASRSQIEVDNMDEDSQKFLEIKKTHYDNVFHNSKLMTHLDTPRIKKKKTKAGGKKTLKMKDTMQRKATRRQISKGAKKGKAVSPRGYLIMS